jgi:hypothetical protein
MTNEDLGKGTVCWKSRHQDWTDRFSSVPRPCHNTGWSTEFWGRLLRSRESGDWKRTLSCIVPKT